MTTRAQGKGFLRELEGLAPDVQEAILIATMRAANKGLARRAIAVVNTAPHPSVAFAALVTATRDYGVACGWTVEQVDQMLAGKRAPDDAPVKATVPV